MECTFGMLCFKFEALGTEVNVVGTDNIMMSVCILHKYSRI
jgi:hypothetical protein